MKNFIKVIITLVLFTSKIIGQPSLNFTKNVNDAELITSDIKNFINAFKSLSNDKDSIQVLQKEYFDKASPGMLDYIGKFDDFNPEFLSKAIQESPETYVAVEDFYNHISVLEADYKKAMEIFNKVVPNPVFPPIHLIIGGNRGIGNGSVLGPLVTIERYSDDYVHLLDLFVHEMIHSKQLTMGFEKYISIFSKKDNLLDMVLREGAADFIAYRLVRQNIGRNMKLKNYEENELKLWERFKKDLVNQDNSYWLSISLKDVEKGIPILIGYGVGYKIVESYYNQSKDKTKALIEILSMEDASAFLKKSNYNPN